MDMQQFRRGLLTASVLASLVLSGCGGNGKADGYGNFESTEIIVSSEASGKLLRFSIEEGDRLEKGAIEALVDTTQLHFTLQQLMAQQKGMATKNHLFGQNRAFTASSAPTCSRMFAVTAALLMKVPLRPGSLKIWRIRLRLLTARLPPLPPATRKLIRR